MQYFIDGYNLMFRLVRAFDDFQTERKNIIEMLNEAAIALNLKIIIFFDAHSQIGIGSRTHFQQVEIFYSELGETADEQILKEIQTKESPKNITVVTSDKWLAVSAKRCKVKTISIDDFVILLRKKRRKKERELNKNSEEKAKSVSIPVPIKEKAKKISCPSKKATFDECFEYYLQEFKKKLDNRRE